MKLSFLVTVHNETSDLNRLLVSLCRFIEAHGATDEIVVLDDFSDNEETQKILGSMREKPYIKIVQHKLDGDFGKHKTHGSRQCSGDYIVQLDSDEYMEVNLLENIKPILECNPTVEVFRLPRLNIVVGMTTDDVRKWGWRVTKLESEEIVNWPDYQSRIYKNSPTIYWTKKLHETIYGATSGTYLPAEPDYAIVHRKTIDRQRAQNEFYNKNWSPTANMGQG